MRVITADLGERHRDGLWLTVHSDLHVGHPQHDPAVLQRELDWLGGASDRYCVLAGDLIENATKDSVGDVYDQTLSPQDQASAVVALYLPHKGKLLAACGGNHEARTYRATGFDPAMIYSAALGVPYNAEGLLLRVRFGQTAHANRGLKRGQAPRASIYLLYVTHGWGAARTLGAKLKNVAELASVVGNADIYVAGHTHQPGYYPLDVYYVGDNADEARRITRHFISVGSALSYAEYAQRKGYSPTTMLFPKIWLGPCTDLYHKGQIRVTFE